MGRCFAVVVSVLAAVLVACEWPNDDYGLCVYDTRGTWHEEDGGWCEPPKRESSPPPIDYSKASDGASTDATDADADAPTIDAADGADAAADRGPADGASDGGPDQ